MKSTWRNKILAEKTTHEDFGALVPIFKSFLKILLKHYQLIFVPQKSLSGKQFKVLLYHS